MAKRSVDSASDGHSKLRKVEEGIGLSEESDSDESMDESLHAVALPSENTVWQTTIEKVVKCVVSIHFGQVINFDSDGAMVSEATGFVVDAEQGLILTNRHVVGAGPFWGYAVFDNHEECDVKPVYRDPVHDFGVLKFDPKNIKYMKVEALQLRPELAKVGCEIRVVGNDAGEKLSILAGFISRLDRNAPDYGDLTYNDFNTEYIQAAASASGGSSGSPVVNVDGYAVALQAGGSTESSTDFFLPVYRAARALKCIQEGNPITRGTIQVQWILRPFDECRRLGLRTETEQELRQAFPHSIGALVAEVVLPEGPADSKLKEGDTLISINGQNISSFVTVDEILDSSVGQEVKLLLQRGGKDLNVSCRVGDLHDITPNRYVEVCGASFNDLSYQMARIYAIPVRGVFVNNATGSFNLDPVDKCGWVIDSIDDRDTPNLNTFVEIMKTIPDSSRVTITYRHLSDLHSPQVTTTQIDRHWHSSFRMATRNDETGLWDFKDLQEKPLPPVKLQPQNAKFVDIPIEEKGCSRLVRSFVLVDTRCPIPVDNFPEERRRAYGVVVDAENGYVIVSRFNVPHDCCDVNLTFAESVILPASVCFLHPTQNYAILKYDPSLILAPVETPKMSSRRLTRGEKVVFVGYNYNLKIVAAATKVSDISSLNVPVSSAEPRYRAVNIESVQVDTSLSTQCGSGVFADEDGTIRALWLSYLGERQGEADSVYKMGMDIAEIHGILQKLKDNSLVDVRIIDAEFHALPLSVAKDRGVPVEWIEKLLATDSDRYQFFDINRVSVPRPNQPVSPLMPGDIVLSVDDKLVHTVSEFNNIVDNTDMRFKVVRRKDVLDLIAPTVTTSNFQTSQLVSWCGALLQEPHQAVRQIMKNLPSMVYVTNRAQGSPARHYGVTTTNFITHVNEQPTTDLESFINVVKDIKDNTYCKLRLVSFDNIPFAITLKTNYHYFPTVALKKDSENKWSEQEIKK